MENANIEISPSSKNNSSMVDNILENINPETLGSSTYTTEGRFTLKNIAVSIILLIVSYTATSIIMSPISVFLFRYLYDNSNIPLLSILSIIQFPLPIVLFVFITHRALGMSYWKAILLFFLDLLIMAGMALVVCGGILLSIGGKW